MKKIFGVILTLFFAIALGACNKKETTEPEDVVRPEQWVKAGELIEEYEKENKKLEEALITISFTDDDGYECIGYIPVLIFTELAPKSAKNFIDLVKDDFYDGLTFHRIIEDFMMQGGNPELKNRKTSGTITGEFEDNKIFNNLELTRGVLAMARTSDDMNSASSQFFIMQDSSTGISGQYAGFGVVIECADKTKTLGDNGELIYYDYAAIDKICALTTDSNDAPEQEVLIVSIEMK